MTPSKKVKGLRRIEATEADILKVCCDYLDAKNILYIRHSPSNVVGGGKSKVSFRRPRASQLGAPDLIVWMISINKIKPAISVAIEAKTRKGKLSKDQIKWQNRAHLNGVGYEIVRSLEDLQVILGLDQVWK